MKEYFAENTMKDFKNSKKLKKLKTQQQDLEYPKYQLKQSNQHYQRNRTLHFYMIT